ncbi:MAG: hypothetical protein KDD45_03640 [Bdellovibrionales bacterium]|nr:hypothetical protein [Bdellovibrionales bacterium]
MIKPGIIDIAYIITHGFAARMLMQTDLLAKLAKRQRKVAVIVTGHDPQLEQYCSQSDVMYFIFNPNLNLPKTYFQKRRYLTGDVLSNAALMDKHMHDVWYSKSKNPVNRIWPFFWLGVNALRRIFPPSNNLFLKKEQKILDNLETQEFLQKLNPRWVISTYPVNFSEAAIIHNAQKIKGVHTCIHLLSWDNITSKGHFPALADKYIAWGPIMKKELQEYYGVNTQDIEMCGVPHFDVHAKIRSTHQYKKRLVALDLDPELPYLFFAMSSPYFAPREIDIVEHLAKKIEAGVLKENIQLVVRPHPQNVQGYLADKSWLPRLEKLNRLKYTAVDFPSLEKDSKINWSISHKDMQRMAILLSGAAVTLNSGSTMSIDALMHFKPVILTSFDGNEKMPYWKSARRLIDFPHLKKIIALKGISIAKSESEMKTHIQRYIDNPNFLKEERMYTLQQQIFDFKGSATDLVINKLEKLVDNDKSIHSS